MYKDSVLVLGSKPGSNLPDIEVGKIYSANGSAERTSIFRKKYSQNYLICVASAREFARNEQVSKRIINSRPERLIIKSGKIHIPSELKSYTELICLTNNQQLKFQSKFFFKKKISILLGETYYKDKFIHKIMHLIKSWKDKNLQGVSTGFFCILLALDENPCSKIIISGIGMMGGKQFYKSERSKYFVYDNRAKVDRYLVSKLSANYKKRLFTTDPDLHDIAGINMWDGNLLQLQ